MFLSTEEVTHFYCSWSLRFDMTKQLVTTVYVKLGEV